MYVSKENQIRFKQQVDELISLKKFDEAFSVASKYWLKGYLCSKKTALIRYKLKESELPHFNQKEVTNPHGGKASPAMILFLEAELSFHKNTNNTHETKNK